MEKPTKSAPVVTSPAGFGPLTALYGVHEQVPVSSSFGLPVLSSVQLQVLLEEVKRVEQLEAALFPSRLPKP